MKLDNRVTVCSGPPMPEHDPEKEVTVTRILRAIRTRLRRKTGNGPKPPLWKALGCQKNKFVRHLIDNLAKIGDPPWADYAVTWHVVNTTGIERIEDERQFNRYFNYRSFKPQMIPKPVESVVLKNQKEVHCG